MPRSFHLRFPSKCFLKMQYADFNLFSFFFCNFKFFSLSTSLPLRLWLSLLILHYDALRSSQICWLHNRCSSQMIMNFHHPSFIFAYNPSTSSLGCNTLYIDIALFYSILFFNSIFSVLFFLKKIPEYLTMNSASILIPLIRCSVAELSWRFNVFFLFFWENYCCIFPSFYSA